MLAKPCKPRQNYNILVDFNITLANRNKKLDVLKIFIKSRENLIHLFTQLLSLVGN